MRRHNSEPAEHNEKLGDKLNALRAGVLGANDGIVSTAGMVIGVASATPELTVILVSGIAGLVAGALSMAGGEYVSVSTQRDTEKAAIEKEKQELKTDYPGEVNELNAIYIAKGLSPKLAREVALELMNKDALAAHAEAELHIEPGKYVNPWTAAFFSLLSYSLGALLPLLSILLLPQALRMQGTFIVVALALALTGYVSAALGGAKRGMAVVRNVIVGGATMLVTYTIGSFIAL